ncbi:hypothetical protein [Leucobacter sp. M11]|uniref:hypothetical protein n=1 Tax=Leucobacter sp. M11 TaxID=2993565 RepID=UPI002D7FBE19|nr:hypothetical protein [Leucobacter sp. M11]MEB4614335.1 hypothetical protein [Leucobacter sp. M11]
MTTPGARRGVTRGYVVGLALMSTVLGIALLVAAWGFIALLGDRRPVTWADAPVFLAPALVILLAAALIWAQWHSAVALLRGRRTPPWATAAVLALGTYLGWGLLGTLGGLPMADTWASPFPLALVVIWPLTLLLFWLVLLRRVYTDRPPPSWPWEKREAAQRAAEDEADRRERDSWGPDGPVDLGN